MTTVPPGQPGPPTLLLRASLALVMLAGRIVPRADREDWRSEWSAELVAFEDRRDDRAPGRSGRFHVLWHALGCLPDAFYLAAHGLGPRALAGDMRRATRALTHRPGFTAAAVVTLGLGIGANTALFSVVRGVLLRPFPYGEPERLMQLMGHREGQAPGAGNVSYPNLRDLAANVGGLESAAGLSAWRPALTEGEPEVLSGATVSWEYFDVLEVVPSAGRFFARSEEGEGREPVVVISHGLWTRRFGGDPSIVGRTLSVNKSPYVVVGVAPAGFEGPHLVSFEGRQPEIWRTPWFEAADWFRSGRSWKGVARLRGDVEAAVVQAEVDAVMSRLQEQYPEENATRRISLRPLRDSIVADSRSALYVLLGAVGLVLLVACVNVANLLIGRLLERYDEFLVRKALGASRGRLLTHLFSESLTIAIAGGSLGVLIAYLGVPAIITLAGPWIPRPEAIAIDGAVLLFASLLALGTAVLFGLLPAMRLAHEADGMQLSGARAGTALGRHVGKVRRALVLAQIGITIVLVVGAGLLLRTFGNLQGVELGVEAGRVVTMNLHGAAWVELEEEEAGVLYRQILDRVGALSGVEAVGAIDVVPLADSYSCDGVTPLDRPPPRPGEGRCAEVRSTTPGALEALGVEARMGRLLEWRDGPDAPGSMVVTQQMAHEFWPNERALGKRALVHGDTFAVVGVVSDLRHFGPQQAVTPMVFLPALQEPWNGISRGLSLVARGVTGDDGLAMAVRDAVHEVDPRIPIERMRAMDDMLAAALGGPRLRASLLVAFSLLALLLALVGVAGVMGQSVARRRRELGIRLALGATPNATARVVLAEGARLTVLGLAAGLLGAAALTRVLQGFVFGVDPLEPSIVFVASVVVCCASLAAAWLPARRAARIDPVEALRSE